MLSPTKRNHSADYKQALARVKQDAIRLGPVDYADVQLAARFWQEPVIEWLRKKYPQLEETLIIPYIPRHLSKAQMITFMADKPRFAQALYEGWKVLQMDGSAMRCRMKLPYQYPGEYSMGLYLGAFPGRALFNVGFQPSKHQKSKAIMALGLLYQGSSNYAGSRRSRRRNNYRTIDDTCSLMTYELALHGMLQHFDASNLALESQCQSPQGMLRVGDIVKVMRAQDEDHKVLFSVSPLRVATIIEQAQSINGIDFSEKVLKLLGETGYDHKLCSRLLKQRSFGFLDLYIAHLQSEKELASKTLVSFGEDYFYIPHRAVKGDFSQHKIALFDSYGNVYVVQGTDIVKLRAEYRPETLDSIQDLERYPVNPCEGIPTLEDCLELVHEFPPLSDPILGEKLATFEAFTRELKGLHYDDEDALFHAATWFFKRGRLQ